MTSTESYRLKGPIGWGTPRIIEENLESFQASRVSFARHLAQELRFPELEEPLHTLFANVTNLPPEAQRALTAIGVANTGRYDVVIGYMVRIPDQPELSQDQTASRELLINTLKDGSVALNKLPDVSTVFFDLDPEKRSFLNSAGEVTIDTELSSIKGPEVKIDFSRGYMAMPQNSWVFSRGKI